MVAVTLGVLLVGAVIEAKLLATVGLVAFRLVAVNTGCCCFAWSEERQLNQINL